MDPALLLFCAGAVLNATGERDMERLGGLIPRMPRAAFAFVVGCIAISALRLPRPRNSPPCTGDFSRIGTSLVLDLFAMLLGEAGG